jgi:rfaE bifunctional protein nucleotidyltransferase chain/domain
MRLLRMNKIKTREELKELVKELKEQGKKIITTNGSFDILHAGHVKFLQEAKEQGDVLIVGVNSDASVKEWKKKMKYKDWDSRPIVPEQYRAEMLAALECVDFVNVYDEADCLKFIESVKPDVHANGEDYGEDCIEAETVKKYGGRIHIIKNFKGFSTSELIRKIKERC